MEATAQLVDPPANDNRAVEKVATILNQIVAEANEFHSEERSFLGRILARSDYSVEKGEATFSEGEYGVADPMYFTPFTIRVRGDPVLQYTLWHTLPEATLTSVPRSCECAEIQDSIDRKLRAAGILIESN